MKVAGMQGRQVTKIWKGREGEKHKGDAMMDAGKVDIKELNRYED